MSLFQKRLKEFIKISGTTQAKIAADLSITPQALSYYLHGREPSYDVLIEMSKYFNASTDFLLGLSAITAHNAQTYQKIAEENMVLRKRLSQIERLCKLTDK